MPDAILLVSLKHCPLVKEGAAYWRHGLSTNVTFVNGGPQRIADPHLLSAGDLIPVGNYIIAVEADASDNTIQAASGDGPVIKHFASGLGLTEADIALADAVKLAAYTGALPRRLTAGRMPLLAATAAHASPPAPGAPRNPPEDAPNPPAELEMLFGPPRRVYLDADRAYDAALQELLDRAKRAAESAAGDTAKRLNAFAPAAIEAQFIAIGRQPKFLSSKKAALWDVYVSQWGASGL